MVSVRTSFHLDRFAADLGTIAATRVSIVEGTLADAPADGFIVMYGMGYELLHFHPELGPRVVAAFTSEGLLLERGRLAAAISDRRYFPWVWEQYYDGGFFGRKDLISAMGLPMREFPRLEHYAELRDSPYDTLPALLVAYLTALARLDPGVCGPP